MDNHFEIFAVCAPGLEPQLLAEVQDAGFGAAKQVPGGVTFEGDWSTVWRANLHLRGASRVLARFGSFRAMHLAQLDKRARKFGWHEVLRADVPCRVEVTCKRSRIYHARAAKQRIEGALKDGLGVDLSPEAPIRLLARIEDDLCTFSVDTSGALLHKRGFKTATVKAPLRENLAALFLRAAAYDPQEPLVDPMCGSGTILLEAAEIAKGLVPGRARSFAFEQLASFDPEAWAEMRAANSANGNMPHLQGTDWDDGAIRSARANAERAGHDTISFERCAISDVTAPEGPPGLVLTNPPYGGRIGNKKPLYALYKSFGDVMRARFSSWRVAFITSDAGLAKATGLPLDAGPHIDHGGIKVRLYQTGPLP